MVKDKSQPPAANGADEPESGLSRGDKAPRSESLGRLQRQLYARDEPAELKMRAKKLKTPRQLQHSRDVLPAQPELVDIIKQRGARRRRVLIRLGMLGVVVAVFVAAAAATVLYRRTQQVTEAQIGISINAPGEFTAGENITYTISYENNSRVAWENVEILFDPPTGFRYQSSQPEAKPSGHQFILPVGSLPSGQRGEVTISGQLIGELNSNVLARSEISISPVNFVKARLTRSETVNTTIVAVPLEISVEATNNAADGERLLATFRVRNTSNAVLDGVVLRLLPADGLQFAAEDEDFSADFSVLDSWWRLPQMQPLEEATRTAVLHISGKAGERRTVEAQGSIINEEDVFVLRQISHLITVSASELSVEQFYGGSDQPQVVIAGQKLQGVVKYKNVGTVGLKNVIVKVKFEGEGFDAATLDLRQGAYAPTNRTITWTAASVPELAAVLPQQGGELNYDFSILPIDQFPTDDSAKNQSLISSATIDSPDLPTPTGQERRVISDRLELPIGTDITLQVDAFYDDGRLGLVSSGPLPPKIGEQTTYTIRFRLGSTLNDIGDVRLVAVVPDGVQYMNSTYKTTGDVQFNERTGEITWSLPLLDGLTGRGKPAQELHVQVGITPGENLRGEEIQLLQSAITEAIDLYTDANVSHRLASFPTTETASPKQGKVE
jgi:uncharacterized repeat protein (TIGR01451 family)